MESSQPVNPASTLSNKVVKNNDKSTDKLNKTIKVSKNKTKKNLSKKKRKQIKYLKSIIPHQSFPNECIQLVNYSSTNTSGQQFDNITVTVPNAASLRTTSQMIQENLADDMILTDVEIINQFPANGKTCPQVLLNNGVHVNTEFNDTELNDTDANFNGQLQYENGPLNQTELFNRFTRLEKKDPLIISIIQEIYPNDKLTDSHLELINQAIKVEIDKLQFNDIIPRFLNSYIKNGAILVKCMDVTSREWLRTLIPQLHPWQTANLKCVRVEHISDIDNINKLYKSYIIIPYHEVPVVVLDRLQKQNPEVDMRGWRIYSNFPGRGRSSGFYLSLGIPGSSMEILRAKGFQLFYGIKQIDVNLCHLPFL